jgi:hypothetical protein
MWGNETEPHLRAVIRSLKLTLFLPELDQLIKASIAHMIRRIGRVIKTPDQISGFRIAHISPPIKSDRLLSVIRLWSSDRSDIAAKLSASRLDPT